MFSFRISEETWTDEGPRLFEFALDWIDVRRWIHDNCSAMAQMHCQRMLHGALQMCIDIVFVVWMRRHFVPTSTSSAPKAR